MYILTLLIYLFISIYLHFKYIFPILLQLYIIIIIIFKE